MVEELVSIKDEFENDDNGMGTANSNFVDDKENPYISDPNVITSISHSILNRFWSNFGF